MSLRRLAASLALALAACEPAAAGERAAALRVWWSGAPEAVEITVSAADLPAPLHVRAAPGATAVVRVPAGRARTFTARAVDAAGLPTHAGATTFDVQPGAGRTAWILLRARHGGEPAALWVAPDGVMPPADPEVAWY